MADFSDESDVNPSEMERMVEDLDDLDNTLLGGSSRKDQFPMVSKQKETTEVKKKVAFKDFNNDDPLADLLSDDETSYETRKPIATNVKSNLVAELFGIKNSKTPEIINETIKPPNPTDLQKIEGTRESTVRGEKLSIPIDKKPPTVRDKSQPNEEITSRAIEDSQQLPNTKERKKLMEDIFGTRARSAPIKEIDSRPSFTKLDFQNPTNIVVSEPTKSDQSAKSSIGYGLDLGTAREPRRGRRNSPVISDPLGLFAVSKQVEPVAQTATDVGKNLDPRPDDKLPQEDLPEWLGGVAKTKETKLETEKPLSHGEKVSEDPTVKSSSLENTRESRTSEQTADSSSRKNPETAIFYPNISTMMGTQFDQQAAIITMQQQEHELKTAATLSHQNEQVSRIVENQRAKLDEQEKMFNVLIKHQIDRQSMLETQMKIQQARIDHYIQTLMSQPTSLPTGVFPEDKSAKETIKEEEEKSSSTESLLKKLELENVYLKNTVEIIQEKHEKEIKILQESHEKQMLFMRQGMEKLEKKMYQDCESLETECEKKIEKMKREKEELEQTYRGEIDRLRKNEKTYIEEIYDRHSQNVGLLQREHAETIDEISRAKEIERQAVDSISNHKNDLGDLLQRSQLVVENFQSLQKKLEEKDQEFGETRGSYLKKQEENLQLLRDQLNLQQESLADERKRLMEISQRLDSGTAQLTTEFKKNSSIINETEERLATRERGLIREKKLFDEQMNWEREHLQMLKDAWAKEQERQMKLIFNEREAVSNERGKLEVFSRLKSGSDDMAKVELEAALKTAQEAANEANLERHKWQEKSRSLDAEKRSFREKEKQLVNRAKELESLTQSALAKRDEGLEALKEAKRVEQRHKEHLVQLQIHLESLAHRDKKKASEKLATAKERLTTRIYQAEKPEKDTLERVSPIHYANERSLISSSHVSTHFKDVVDPHLLLLKLNLDNKLDTTDELLTTMRVIGQ